MIPPIAFFEFLVAVLIVVVVLFIPIFVVAFIIDWFSQRKWDRKNEEK